MSEVLPMPMQVPITGSSSLVQYAPCRACDPGQGWQATPDFFNTTAQDPQDVGFVTSATSANVTISFYGSGLKFNLGYSLESEAVGPGAGSSSQDPGSAWNTTILVNGTAPPETATVGKSSVMELPPGTHDVTCILTQTGEGNATWAQFQGAVVTLVKHVEAGTTNTTIDDTAWRSEQIWLSPGWNMLETNGESNYLDEADYQSEQQTAGQMHNGSVTWTTQTDASTSINFVGSAVWAYGMTGGDAGTFEAFIDDTSRGTFDSAGGPRTYNQTLFFASGLAEGAHTLRLVNKGGRLSYDRVVATAGLVDPPLNADPPLGTQTLSTTSVAPPPTAVGLPSQAATHAPSASNKQGLPTSTIVGAAVGASVGVVALALLGFLIFYCCRRRKRHQAGGSDWDNRPWYKRCLSRDKGWRFAEIHDDPNHNNTRQTPAQRGSVFGRVSRSDTHISSSSFGSTPDNWDSNGMPKSSSSRSLFGTGLFTRSRGSLSAKSTAQVPMTEVRSDPMQSALNNGVSPLTRIQKSFHPGDETAATRPPANAYLAAPAPNERERAYPRDKSRLAPGTYGNSPGGGGGNGNGNGGSTWSDWFGLSMYGGRMSMKSGKSGQGLFGLGGQANAHAHAHAQQPTPAGYSRTRDRLPQQQQQQQSAAIGLALSPVGQGGYPPSSESYAAGRQQSRTPRTPPRAAGQNRYAGA